MHTHITIAGILVLFVLFTGQRATASSKAVKKSDDVSSELDDMRELPPISKKLNKKWRWELPINAESGMGYMHGDGTKDGIGFFVPIEIDLEPGFQRGKRLLRIGLDASYDGRETIEFDLAKRHIHAGPTFRLRPGSQWDIGISSDSGYCLKPDWPDNYQPITTIDDVNGDVQPTGSFRGTDRNSYVHVGGDGYLKYRFSRRFSGKIYGGYNFRNYKDDPNYSQTDAPTHLVPGDRHQSTGGVQFTGTTNKRFWRFTVDTRLEDKKYTRTYARDAQTGLTHASAGGAPPNPRQHFRSFRVRQRNSFKLIDDLLGLVLIETVTRNKDLFAGYFTSNAISLDVNLSWTPLKRFELALGYDISYRKYTSNGYQESDNWPDNRHHPPLDNGDTIRDELTWAIHSRAELAVGIANLRLFTEGDLKKNITNFPDYSPGIFPVNQQYRIDWDYLNWQLLFGVAFEL